MLYPSNGVSDIFIARGPHIGWETVWGVLHLSPDESCLHHPEMDKLLRKWVDGCYCQGTFRLFWHCVVTQQQTKGLYAGFSFQLWPIYSLSFMSICHC